MMLVGIAVIVGLFVAVVALLAVGLRLGQWRPLPQDAAARPGLVAAEGAVFALMGLVLAFSFSGALSRWDTRRAHITEEVNCIGTAYLRLDLLPAAEQPPIRQQMRDYVDARVAVYRDVLDEEATRQDAANATAIQGEIWKLALPACGKADAATKMLIVTSLNEMFDMATRRDLTAISHPPLAVFLMLAAAVVTSSLLAGYDMAGSKKASSFHIVGYAAMVSLTLYVTLDIEFPRVGFVRLDVADQAFVDLKAGMK